MKELEKQFWKILKWSPNEPLYGEENKRKIAMLIQSVEDYFKRSGKQGGNSTKKKFGKEHFSQIKKQWWDEQKKKR